tara:strand:- start:189 stop:389 length:201 start_codon:yes stop_codon:yes gene_type:complete
MDSNMKWVMGELVSNSTIIKDGVDLRKEFHEVINRHPLTKFWSFGVKDTIVEQLYKRVTKDAKFKR